MKVKELIKSEKESLQVIDIREPYEVEDGCICDLNIPMNDVIRRVAELDKNKKIILYCNTGKRSRSMVYILKTQFNINNIEELEGGFQAWQEINVNIIS